MSDYTKLDCAELTHALGMDGYKHAEAFKQYHPNCNVDDGDLIGWFCNATMAGYDHAHGNPPMNGDHAQWLLDRLTTPPPITGNEGEGS